MLTIIRKNKEPWTVVIWRPEMTAYDAHDLEGHALRVPTPHRPTFGLSGGLV